MQLTEDFIHYLWKFRLFDQQHLKTVDGQALEIIRVGEHNKDAGPDFGAALIRMGDTLWAGNVEIHIRSSDWTRHLHQSDRAYDNVILHVVAYHDRDVLRDDGTRIPVLEISGLIPQQTADRYRYLQESMEWIPCIKRLPELEHVYIRNWLYRIGIERIEEKSGLTDHILSEYKGSWDDAFYISLARNFGFKTNALPFEMLARSLPRSLLAAYLNRSIRVEALIFGQAGFLEQKYEGTYPQALCKEYEFLKKKHVLKPLDKFLWKYMRLRPRNFPTLRLAQFTALIICSNHLFSRILAEKDPGMIIRMFTDLPVNSYWCTHYRFDKPAKRTSATLGEQSVINILINTVAVFLMAYGRHTGSDDYRSRSLALLENLPAESNAIISRFRVAGVYPDNAFFSQSLIQLKKSYCDQKKCLSCGIGMKLLNI
jgi:hypothetical protein